MFERKNLVARTKRGNNLQELIFPTVQKKKSNTRRIGPVLPRGSFPCEHFKAGRKCYLCKQVEDEVEYIVSFIYQISDDHRSKTYVGSAVDMYGRWAKHKSDCNRGSTATGLFAHF